MRQILQLMKKILQSCFVLSTKSQLAAYTAKQTLQDFGSCFVHIKGCRVYINLGDIITFFKQKTMIV